MSLSINTPKAIRLIVAIVTGALLLVAVVAIDATAGRHIRSVDLFVVDGGPLVVDEDPVGLGPGDTLLFDDEVHDVDGDAVGDAITRVTLVAAEQGDDLVFLLDCTVRTDDGDLVFAGAGQFSQLDSGVTFVVTGGTGIYAGANGTVTGTATEVEGTPGTGLAFRFTRP